MSEEKSCCPIGSEKALSTDYKPMGEMIQVGGDLPTYAVGKGSKAIVVIPDIFGFASGRTRLIADQLAHEGYRVLMPRLMPNEAGDGGDGYSSSADLSDPKVMEDLMKFIGTNPWEGKVKLGMDKVFKLLNDEKIEKIGMIGFCWGCWVNFKASATATYNVSAAVNCHPSTRIEGPLGGSELELAKSVKCPQLLQPAGNDPDNLKEGGEVWNALKAIADIGDKMELRVFPDQAHGFVTRGDVTKEDTQRDVKAAMENAVKFLKANL